MEFVNAIWQKSLIKNREQESLPALYFYYYAKKSFYKK